MELHFTYHIFRAFQRRNILRSRRRCNYFNKLNRSEGIFTTEKNELEQKLMSAIVKLNEAKDILEKLLNKMIQKITINYDFYRIHIVLKDGIEIFIVYNNYDGYRYSVLFSINKTINSYKFVKTLIDQS